MPNEGHPKPARTATCPICGKTTAAAWRPFCSKRCADVDLSRWLKGSYAIPGEPAEGPAEPDGED